MTSGPHGIALQAACGPWAAGWKALPYTICMDMISVNRYFAMKVKRHILRHMFIEYFAMVIVTKSIEGFHVMSYQANFASHHTRDCHVGFLCTRRYLLVNMTKCPITFLFSLYRNIKLQLSDNNIGLCAHCWNYRSFNEVNQRFKRFCCFSLYHTIQKGKQGSWQNCAHKGAHCLMQTLYNARTSKMNMGPRNMNLVLSK